MPKKFYAVHRGVVPGVYLSWPECQKQTNGFRGAVFKGFPTREEAQRFADYGPGNGQSYSSKPQPQGNQLQPASGRSIPSEASNNGPIAHAFQEGDFWIPRAPSVPRDSRPYTEADRIPVYTDGCARSNGRVGSYAGIGVYYGPHDERNVAEPIFGPKQTNQVAELTAILKALDRAIIEAESSGRGVEILTDSMYAIQCFTVWSDRWIQNGWKTSAGKSVENGVLVIHGLSIISAIENALHRHQLYRGVVFRHCKGHMGIPGNEEADRLANQGAESNTLYK